jgi:hypothetical protein
VTDDATAAEVDALLAAHGDWRSDVLARARELIHEALPDVTEAVKWRKPSNPGGVPVFERDGIICTLEAFTGKAKITFARGARLADPSGIFNGSLGGNTMRAIDVREGDDLDEAAFVAMVRAAAAHNAA